MDVNRVAPKPGKYQLKKAIEELQSHIVQKLRHTDDIIAYLFGTHDLNQTQYDKIEHFGVRNLYSEQLEYLMECILADDNVNMSEHFYQACEQSSVNAQLCNNIADEASQHCEEWLEVHTLCKDVIRDQNLKFVKNLKDVDCIYAKMTTQGLFCDFTTTEDLSYIKMSRIDKSKEILRRLLTMDVSKILKFVILLGENKCNKELYKTLVESEKYRAAIKKLNSLSNVMISEVKKSMLKYSCIKPIPDQLFKSFHLDLVNDAEKLMKLKGTCVMPKPKINPQDGKAEAKWKNGEDVYKIKDVDILFEQTLDRVTLVQGDPGSGKTVFLRRWAIEWAHKAENMQQTEESIEQTQEIIEQKEKIIIFIPLRDVSSVSLSDIMFNDLNILPRKYQAVWEHFVIHEDFSKRLLFLLDGADEKLLDKQSDIMKIIKGDEETFKESRVIITTRMYQNVIKKFKPFTNSIMILSGVSAESRDNFIQCMIGEGIKPEDVQHFVLKCKDYFFEEDVLAVPIYLTLLCILGRDHHQKNKNASLKTMVLPKTIYMLYDTFVKIFKDRFLSILGEVSWHNQEQIKKNMFLIGRMSFRGLCRRQYSFSVDDLVTECYLDQNMIEHIGFFTEETFTSGKNTYCFYHKTFQEYFAGQYCAVEGFSMTVPHLLLSTEEMFKNKSILDGFENAVQNPASVTLSSRRKRMSGLLRSKTLRETVHPLEVALQFAAGASKEFARELLLFGADACSIAEDRAAYDTSYASSLVYECHDPELMHVYSEYLLQARKTTKVEPRSTLPNPYNKAVYQFIATHLPNKNKCDILRNLYNLEANIYTSRESEGMFCVGKPSKKSDMLLSCLIANTLPSVITLKGREVDLKTLIPIVQQNNNLEVLKLANTDLSKFGKDVLHEFLDVLSKLPNLRHLKFPFCNLQAEQFTAIFGCLNKLSNEFRLVDISGNSMEQMKRNEQKVVQKHINTFCDTLVIEQNCIKQLSCKDEAHGVSWKLDQMYVKSLAPILEEQTNLSQLKVYDSVLGETQSADLWKPMLDMMQKWNKVTHLTLSGCQINTDNLIAELGCTVANLNQLKYFDLSKNNLMEVSDKIWKALLQALSSNKTVSHLIMCECSIGTASKIGILGSVMNEFIHLEHFDFAGNNLSNIPIKQWEFFGDELSKLNQLKHLDASSCCLNNIAILGRAISQMPCLEHLNLSNLCNDINKDNWQKLLDGMKMCSKIKDLNMSSNKEHASVPLELLTELFKDQSTLQKLNFSGNKFPKTEKGNWESLCGNLTKCEHLEHLNLSNCNLNQDFHIEYLGKVMEGTKQLLSLDISDNYISSIKEDTWTVFISCLSSVQLANLRISKCFIHANVSNHVAAMNPGQLKQLTHLEMPHNRLGDVTDRQWNDFTTGLKSCNHLKYLKLSKNNLKHIHLRLLGQVLGGLKSLEHLNLDDNNFFRTTETEWEDFTCCLSNCDGLVKLKLSKCSLNHSFQLRKIGDMLQHLKALEHLDISENKFSSVDEMSWNKFTNGIKQCRALDKLNLHKCGLNQRFHFINVAELFPVLTYLHRLNMNDNSFSVLKESDWKLFTLNLQTCKRLQKLELAGTGLNEAYFWDYLGSTLESLPRLFHLSLSWNNMSKFKNNVLKEFSGSITRCTQLKCLNFPLRNKKCKSRDRQDSFSSWQNEHDVSLQQFLDDCLSDV